MYDFNVIFATLFDFPSFNRVNYYSNYHFYYHHIFYYYFQDFWNYANFWIFFRANFQSELTGRRPQIRRPSSYERSSVLTNTTQLQNNTSRRSSKINDTNNLTEKYGKNGIYGNTESKLPLFTETDRHPIAGNVESSFSDLCKYWW